MGTPCMTGSPYTKLLEAIEFAEENRATVSAIVDAYRDGTARTLERHHREAGMRPPTEREITVAAQLRAQSDTQFGVAINNERWGWRLATMYAGQVAARNEVTTHSLLRDMLEQLRVLNRQTAELIAATRRDG